MLPLEVADSIRRTAEAEGFLLRVKRLLDALAEFDGKPVTAAPRGLRIEFLAIAKELRPGLEKRGEWLPEHSEMVAACEESLK